MTIKYSSHQFLNIPEFREKTNVLNTNWGKLMAFCTAIFDARQSNTKLTKEFLDTLMRDKFGRVSKDFIKFYNSFASIHSGYSRNFNTINYTETEVTTPDNDVNNIGARFRLEFPLLNVVENNQMNWLNVDEQEKNLFVANNYHQPLPTTDAEVEQYLGVINKFIAKELEPIAQVGKMYGSPCKEHLDNINFGVDLKAQAFLFTFNRKLYQVPFAFIQASREYMHHCLLRHGYFNVDENIWYSTMTDTTRKVIDDTRRQLNSSENGRKRLQLVLIILMYAGIKLNKHIFRPYRDNVGYGFGGDMADSNTFFQRYVLDKLAFSPEQVGDVYLTPDRESLAVNRNNFSNLSLSINAHTGNDYGMSMYFYSHFKIIRQPYGTRDVLGLSAPHTQAYLKGRLTLVPPSDVEGVLANYRMFTEDALQRCIVYVTRTGARPNPDQQGITDGFTMDLETLTVQRLRQGTKRRGGYHNYNRINGFWSEDGVDTAESNDKNGNPRLYFGVEIETEANGNQQLITFATDIINHNYYWLNNWLVPERDGSLKDGGIEWVSTPCTPLVAIEMARLFTMCDLVKDCLVTSTNCGIHIHANRRYFTATSFAKYFRFMGGDTINRDFISFIAERSSTQWAKMLDKKLTDGELIHKAYLQNKGEEQMTMTERREYESIHAKFGAKYNALNVMPRNTYECRIFQSRIDDRLIKDIQFLYAVIRFSTYVHRCKLSSGDFIKWLLRWKDNEKQYPKDTFVELIGWLRQESNMKPEEPDDNLYDALLTMKRIRPVTSAATASEQDKKEKLERERLSEKK